jgi:hypothetical protein
MEGESCCCWSEKKNHKVKEEGERSALNKWKSKNQKSLPASIIQKGEDCVYIVRAVVEGYIQGVVYRRIREVYTVL